MFQILLVLFDIFFNLKDIKINVIKEKNNGKCEMNRRQFLYASAGVGSLLTFNSCSRSKSSNGLNFQRNVPVSEKYDVVVCGAGPSGVAAAISAKRSGLNVLLVEAQGQFGGVGVSALVSHWLGGRTDDCQRWVVGGIFKEMATEAADAKIALLPKPLKNGRLSAHGWSHAGQLTAGVPFDPFAMARFLDEKINNEKIDFLLSTNVVDVVLENDLIKYVIIYNKSGFAAVPADAFIDATGDGDIAAKSNCQYVKGRDEDHLMAAATLQFHVYNVDQDALSDYIHENNSRRFREKIKQLRKMGEWPFPYDIFISVQLHEKGTMMINTSRLVGVDGTDGRSVSEALVKGREETFLLLEKMKKHFPGFKNAKIRAVAPVLGVRETRRIIGNYILTVKDLNTGKEFKDTIGFSAYCWDLPDPKKPSVNPEHGQRKEVTSIPYRILVPQPVKNLICPGRAVSVERPVMGPLRVMAPCMAMGEAAGKAAAQVISKNIGFSQVNITELKNELEKAGAIITWS